MFYFTIGLHYCKISKKMIMRKLKNAVSKTKRTTVLLLAIVTVMITAFQGCQNSGEDLNVKQKLTPELIGKLHNEALDNIFKNESKFNFNTSVDGLKEQVLNENKLFLEKAVSDFELSKEVNNFEPKNAYDLLDTSELLTKNLARTYPKRESFSIEESNIFDKIDFLYKSKVINSDDKKVLDELYQAYKDNYKGVIDDKELLKISKVIKDNYKLNHNDLSKVNQYTTLSILEISTNSLEWFSINMDKLQKSANHNGKFTKEQKVLFWNIVAADAIGAIVGIGETIVQDALVNGTNGPVDGNTIVAGAFVGAVVGSVGSVLKVGKWFSKLF